MARSGLVIGIGNLDRGDDGVGRAVARALRDLVPPETEVVETDGDATTLLALLEDTVRAVVIDASASGAPPGTIRRFDVGIRALPHLRGSMSTHGMGLEEAIELARALGSVPPVCLVYAIEGASFDTGATLSPAVAAAIIEVAARVAEDIRRFQFATPEVACTKAT